MHAAHVYAGAHATAMPQMGQAPAMAQVAAPDAAQQAASLAQLSAFGFDEASARAALQATGWDVQAAANRLLG